MTHHPIAEMCAAAAAAAKQLRRTSREQRAGLLDTIAGALDERRSAIVESLAAETLLEHGRLDGEMTRTINQLRLLGDHAWDPAPLVVEPPDPSAAPPHPGLRRALIPIGPVAVFAASNFPLAFGVIGGDTASALAAGCAVVVKPHPGHPQSSRLLADVLATGIDRADFPSATAAVLDDTSVEAGVALVNDPNIEAVGFTGSLGGGRALYDLAAARPRPIPVFAEMGSINPLLITRTALEARGDAIAEQVAASILGSTGQFCTKPGVIVIPSVGAEAFLERVRAHLDTAPMPMLTDYMASAFEQRARATTSKETVDVLLRTSRHDRAVTPAAVVTDAATFLDDPALREENFGPYAVVVTAEPSEWLDLLDASGGQLTVTIHGEPSDADWLKPILADIAAHAGRIVWNGVPTGVTVSPAQQHGGPYPATTAPWSTSVGTSSIDRWLRPVTWQSFPEEMIPA